MAEVIANELIKVVFQKLADKALKEIVRSQGIQSELKNLEKTLSKIQKLLTDASEKENGDEDVKNWLNSLQHLAYDIDDILDGLATDAKIRELNGESGGNTSRVRKFIPTCCIKFSLSNQFSHKLDTIATKLKALEKEKQALGLNVKDEKPKSASRRYETSLPEAYVVGREDEKNKLLHKLLEDEEPFDQKFSVVPIVGMGGVGKTTLARFLYNETKVKEHFDLKAWACISDDFDVLKISKTIFQDLTGENKNFENLNQVQMAIMEQLKKGRFLLVLDDVWSESYDDWELLVRPFQSCAPGSKVIMTTRKDIMLKQLGFDHLDHVASLSPDDALSLFAYHALDEYNFDSHTALKPQGERIVNKCGGLPLALKAIGRLLRTNTDVERWEEVLKSEIWGLENDKIVPALRLSYYDLPACLKQLFAYCSLFPKDFLFDKDDLVLLWMAEGFLNESSGSMSMERLGHDYFDTLLSRSFFQQAPNYESLYVMHDLMNDLAVFVAGDYFLRFDNQMETEEESLAKFRHMSFIKEEYVAYKKFETFKRAKALRTFLPVYVGVKERWHFFYLSTKILTDLLRELPFLRVLCLSCFEITEVPKFIGSLKHLRYLNLSQTQIGELPENVCSLYNLQTLILFGCQDLSKLPNSFLKLENLRHFDIRDTPSLKKMPSGIGEVKNLQILTKIIIGGDDGFAITELKKLKNLHGKTSIEGLDTVKNAMYARDMNFSENRLTELELKWSNEFDGSRNETIEKQVLNELKPHSDKLKKLGIKSYGGAEFPNWVGDPSFLQLVHISIYGCRKCTSLSSLAQLPSLKELYVEDMNEMKVVSLELRESTIGVAFPSLEVLHFRNMDGWEVWSPNNGVGFPRLRELCISGCPNLVEVSLEELPSLEILRFKDLRGWKVWSTNNGFMFPRLREFSMSGCSNLVELSFESLPSLEILRFEDMTGWKVWSKKSGIVFPRLMELCIRKCPNLVEVSFESLPSLRVLDIKECSDDLLRCIVRAAPSVTKLKIINIFGLSDEAWKDVMMYLGAVEELVISDCNEIRYLWESQAHVSKVLINLRELRVYDCSKMMSLGEKEEEEEINCGSLLLLTSLRKLNIRDCESMKHCICGNSIESLTIWFCSSMTSVFFPTSTSTITRGGEQKQNLKSLSISGCEKLLIKELGGGEQNNATSRKMAMLESVYIDNWQSLKSIIELGYSVHLTSLTIMHCPSLESFPNRELVNLSALKYLTIINCPSMDVSFPGGHWPPNMCSLEIGMLKKPISEWGNQNFPTSLVDITLEGMGDEEECNNIHQLSAIVPSSLTKLVISDFKKLERVSTGLQHLTSLQHLIIRYCDNIKDVPETLLPSLLSLTIWKCPKLKEKTHGRGSRYWPLISHIPQIDIE